MREWEGGEKEIQPPCTDRCLAALSEIWPVGTDPKAPYVAVNSSPPKRLVV